VAMPGAWDVDTSGSVIWARRGPSNRPHLQYQHVSGKYRQGSARGRLGYTRTPVRARPGARGRCRHGTGHGTASYPRMPDFQRVDERNTTRPASPQNELSTGTWVGSPVRHGRPCDADHRVDAQGLTQAGRSVVTGVESSCTCRPAKPRWYAAVDLHPNPARHQPAPSRRRPGRATRPGRHRSARPSKVRA